MIPRIHDLHLLYFYLTTGHPMVGSSGISSDSAHGRPARERSRRHVRPVAGLAGAVRICAVPVRIAGRIPGRMSPGCCPPG